MDQLSLGFEAEIKEPEKPANRCRNCEFIFEHQWRSDWKYCGKQKSPRTGTGYKKIKANDLSCQLFKQKEKNLNYGRRTIKN